MKINMIGIGKMGYPLVLNMLENGHEVFVYDISNENIKKIKNDKNVNGTTNFDSFIRDSIKEGERRIFWVMLPPESITNEMLSLLANVTLEGDIVIDGGNSDHRDSIRHGEELAKKGVYFYDVGTSGGVDGARNGASFMVGGDEEIFTIIEPLIASLAMEKGYIYTGKTGSGHFLKLVHNAIYYGYQQSLGEGLEILHKSEFDYDLAAVTGALKDSSVIRGWLLEVVHSMFETDSDLSSFGTEIKGSRSTNWVIEEAIKLGVPVPAIGSALTMRQRSIQDSESFSGKVISAIRAGVGGYKTK